VALAAAAPATAHASVRITTDPSLRPAYKSSVPDYVSRCAPGKPLRFSVSATGGDEVAIGSGPARHGSFTVDVPVQTASDVTVRVTSSGQAKTHHVRCLPQDFPDWTTHRHGTPQAQWYVITPLGPRPSGYVAVFDARGVPVWWFYSSTYGPWDGKLLPNGNLIWARQLNDLFSVNDAVGWEEHSLDGKTLRVLKTQGTPTDWHDLEPMPNGHFLLECYRPRSHVDLSSHGGPKDANVYDGEIQELDVSGKRVWSWNSKDHIKLDEIRWWKWLKDRQKKRPPDKRVYDLVHLNSVEPDGDGVIVSSRYLDAVFRIDKRSGRVTWKLGGTRTKRSLAISNDPLASHPFSGQHDARKYRDGTVTVFDNGTLEKRPPRVVRYRIDTNARTARLVEGFGQSDVPFSGWGGSARKLPGGNWVMQWGGTALMTERTPGGKRVLDIDFKDDMHSYRAFPIAKGRVSAQSFRRGMTALAQSGAAGGR
jgi:hypothetical protein